MGPGTQVPQVGVEPTASLFLKESGLPVAYRGGFDAFPWSVAHRQLSAGANRCRQKMGDGPGTTSSVLGAGIEPTPPGSEPGILPLNYPRARSVRGEGLEPPQAASKAASLPLADPRNVARRKRRELNPQGSRSPGFEPGAVANRLALPFCPSSAIAPWENDNGRQTGDSGPVRAAPAGFEPALHPLTAGGTTVMPRSKITGQDGWIRTSTLRLPTPAD